jgi:hypothetical protein
MKAIAVMISAVLVIMLANAAIEMLARMTWLGPVFAVSVIMATIVVIVRLTFDLLRDLK